MILYVDSSTVVSVHFQEPLRYEASVLAVEAAEAVATSAITYAEARAALARAAFKERPARLSLRDYRNAIADFERDWPAYFRIQLSEALVREAGILAEKHRLRGYDAVHLASVMALRDGVSDPIQFSSWDRELAEAARNEGLFPGE